MFFYYGKVRWEYQKHERALLEPWRLELRHRGPFFMIIECSPNLVNP